MPEGVALLPWEFSSANDKISCVIRVLFTKKTTAKLWNAGNADSFYGFLKGCGFLLFCLGVLFLLGRDVRPTWGVASIPSLKWQTRQPSLSELGFLG
jgi:hypothetical protein